MAVTETCSTCFELQDVNFTTGEHIRAVARWQLASIDKDSSAEVSALKAALETPAEARTEATATYKAHCENHSFGPVRPR
jgi:hypothetical protein